MPIAKPYASGTTTPVERSRSELEALLKKHGASEFGVYEDRAGTVSVIFRLKERMVRHRITRPEVRNEHKQQAEMRRRWRALILITKAKLEVIASGDSTFEREFLADVLLRDGQTVGESLTPQLCAHYTEGEPQPLMLGGGR